MQPPLITIIIPTYRRPKLLAKAIKSALSQTIKNLQVYICDNASEDETSDVVEELRKVDKRIHYFSQKQNIGMLANYEFGRSLVTTQYFSFLSDDDILFPSFCEIALKEFENYPDIAFAAASTLIVNLEYALLDDPIARWPREGCFLPHEGIVEMVGKYPAPNTVLFRTECVKSISIDHENKVMWDCDFLLKIASRYPISIRKQPAGLFFVHDNSFTYTLNHRHWIDANEKLLLSIQKSDVIPKKIKTRITSKFTNEMIRKAFRGLFRHIMNKDEKTASFYENFLSARKHEFKFKPNLYWSIFKLRKVFPFMPFLLDFAWRMKRKRRKIISKEYSYWNSHFEKDYQEIISTSGIGQTNFPPH